MYCSILLYTKICFLLWNVIRTSKIRNIPAHFNVLYWLTRWFQSAIIIFAEIANNKFCLRYFHNIKERFKYWWSVQYSLCRFFFSLSIPVSLYGVTEFLLHLKEVQNSVSFDFIRSDMSLAGLWFKLIFKYDHISAHIEMMNATNRKKMYTEWILNGSKQKKNKSNNNILFPKLKTWSDSHKPHAKSCMNFGRKPKWKMLIPNDTVKSEHRVTNQMAGNGGAFEPVQNQFIFRI